MQVSNDWWKGSVNGKEGLIPDKYISVKIKLVLIFLYETLSIKTSSIHILGKLLKTILYHLANK